MKKINLKWAIITFVSFVLFGVLLTLFWIKRSITVDDMLFFAMVGLITAPAVGYLGPKFGNQIRESRELREKQDQKQE